MTNHCQMKNSKKTERSWIRSWRNIVMNQNPMKKSKKTKRNWIRSGRNNKVMNQNPMKNSKKKKRSWIRSVRNKVVRQHLERGLQSTSRSMAIKGTRGHKTLMKNTNRKKLRECISSITRFRTEPLSGISTNRRTWI